MAIKRLSEKYYWGIVFVIASIMYLSLIGGKYIWADEAYSFAMIKHSFKEIFSITAADVHPPLYYFGLKVFLAPFSDNLYMAKVFSVIPYLLILIIGYKNISEISNPRAALIFCVLFVSFPFSLYYSYEIRMYSWACFFVFSSFLYAIRSYESGSIRHFFIYTVMTICAAYTHYFSLVAVGLVALVLLVAMLVKKKDIKRYLFFLIACVVLYSPWLRSFFKQLEDKVNNEYWIEKINRYTLLSWWKEVFGLEGIDCYYLIYSLLFVILFLYLLNSKNNRFINLSLFSLVIIGGTAFIGVALSVLVRPIFIIRYISPMIPCLILPIAFSISSIRNRYVIYGLLALYIIAGAINYKSKLCDEYSHIPNSLDEAFVENDSDAYVVYTYAQVASVLAYYENAKPIYGDLDTSLQANPFENRFELSKLRYNDYETIIVMCEKDSEAPQIEGFEKKYITTLNVTGMMTDTYKYQRENAFE